MTREYAAVGRSVASAGAIAMLGGGLLLYQLTTLVLGPQGSRQMALSISLPVVESQDGTEPIQAHSNLVVGSLARVDTAFPARSSRAVGPTGIPSLPLRAAATTVSRRVTAPTSPTSQPVAIVPPAPKPQPRPLPPVGRIVPLPADGDAADAHHPAAELIPVVRESRDRD